MSKVPRRGSNREDTHHNKKDVKRALKSPCDRPPATPTNLVGTFDRSEGGKGGHRIRLKMRWDEVNRDTAGFRMRVKHYRLEVEYSANGTDWFLQSRHSVPKRKENLPLSGAFNPSGTTFEYVFVAEHGLSIGDEVTIEGCNTDAGGSEFNGTFTVTAVPSLQSIWVDGGAGTGFAPINNRGHGEDLVDRDKDHYALKGIKGRLQYQFRVKAIALEKCDSDWSVWDTVGAPNAETPPAPTNVRIYDRSVDRVVLDWDDTADPNDTERRRDDQTYFSAELSVVSNFNTIYKRDRHIGHTRWSVRIPDADTGGIFYGRVWSNNDTGDKNFKSLKIPGTFAGNSDPNATPDFVFLKEIGAGASTCDPGEIRKHAGPLKPAWSRCVSGSPSVASGAPKLVCDGCSYSTTNYAALFAEIGYIYGGSGGSFNVPDLRHRKVTGASSDAELGQNDGLAVTDRNDDHAIHGDHPNHGTHAHDGHTGHNAHRTDNVAEQTHQHYVQSQQSDGPTSSQFNISAQGSQHLATDQHRHSIGNFFTNQGASHAHQHNVGHDDAAGSRGHQDHSTHQGHNHNEHNAGEHDSNRPAGQGHKPHGHQKHHFVICT